MSTKNKITDYQFKRIRKSIQDALDVNLKIKTEISVEDLYAKTLSLKAFEKFKSLFKYSIFTNNTSGLIMCAFLEFEDKDKDTIKVNEEISKVIEFLEKIFIFLDAVKINRSSNGSTHCVIIKAVKNTIPEHLISKEEKING